MLSNRAISTSRMPMRQRARPYTDPIFSGQALGSAVVQNLKRESLALLRYVLRSSPVKRVKLTGTPFPKTRKSLLDPIPTSFTDDLESELCWTAAVMLHHAEQINCFLREQGEFEASLLSGDFDSADEARRRALNDLHESYWGMETQFLLVECRDGFESNRDLLTSCLKEGEQYIREGCRNFLSLFAQLFSQRVEQNLSVSEYDHYCAFLKPTTDDQIAVKRMRGYLQFRLNYHTFDQFDLLPFVVHMEESHALIDRYNTFVRVLLTLAVTDSILVTSHRVSMALGALVAELDDSRLEVINSLTARRGSQTRDLPAALFAVMDCYTRGEYLRARDLSIDALREHPAMFELYEISAKATVRAGVSLSNPFRAGTFAYEILNALYHILARDADMPAALERLLQIAYQMDCCRVGIQLYAFHQQHARGRYPLSKDRGILLTANYPTPRLSLLLSDAEAAELYLSALDSTSSQNAAIHLFRTYWRSISDMSYHQAIVDVPESRECKFKAHALERMGQYEDALAEYRRLATFAEDTPSLSADAATGQYQCCIKLGRITNAADVLAEAVVLQPHLIPAGTLHEIVQYLGNAETDQKNIACPVLACSAQRESLSLDTDPIHDALDDFLTAWGVQRPSELVEFAGSFKVHLLTYLLRYACLPDVLDSSIWYSSQTEVEGERIRICEWLSELEPDNRDVFNREIAELTQLATMRELTHKVERSRVYVDASGIRQVLPESLRDRISRCLAFSRIKREELRQSFELSPAFEQLLEETKVLYIDEGFRIFRGLFDDIRAEFLSSTEYGLDSNLSQRIRHGTLAGEIRAQFEESHLVTLKDASGQYGENAYWIDELGPPDEERQRMCEILAQLSSRVDQTISVVRNEWIQIRSEAVPDGMFDYDFGPQQLHEPYQQVVKIHGDESFLDFVFDVLWQRTDENLHNVRAAIKNELRRLLFEALDECEARMGELAPPNAMSPFRVAITRCRTQLAYALESIADWFSIDHSQQIQDFPLPALVNSLLGVVSRCSGPSRLHVRSSIDDTKPVPGALFRGLWDLMFILLDNAAKHSKLESTNVDLTLEIGNGGLSVAVTNDLGKDVDHEAIRRVVDGIATPDIGVAVAEGVRREGGTGLLKLHKIIRHDLGANEDYLIDPMITNDGRFSVEISLGGVSQ